MMKRLNRILVAGLCLLCGTVGSAFASVARAESASAADMPVLTEIASVSFLPAEGRVETTQSLYRKTLPVSPHTGLTDPVSYVMNGQHLEFTLKNGADASFAQDANASGEIYLDFWVFTTRPQANFTGGNQIEIGSVYEGHDTDEYHWNASDVFWQQGETNGRPYRAGAWNRVRLPFKGHLQGDVDMADLKHFRLYYLSPSDDTTTLVSDLRIVRTTDNVEGIVGYAECATATFGAVTLPANKTEGDRVTYEIPEVTDLDGTSISAKKITVSTTGPNGYVMDGKSVALEDGPGRYTVTFTARDLMGQLCTETAEFDVAASATDTAAPRIAVADMPKDFMVGKEYRLDGALTIRDNRGYAALEVTASVVSQSGAEVATFAKSAGEDKPWTLLFAPTENSEYTLSVAARDAAGNRTEEKFSLKTYVAPRADRVVRLFDETTSELEFRVGSTKGRLVDARPEGGYGRSIEFAYEGGATDNSDTSSYYDEMVLVNNNPADLSDIDLRWACVKMWIYIDRTTAQDQTFMPENGGGFGNMGMGFASKVGIYGNARMEAPLYELSRAGLQAGWNEVTMKFGRTFDGEVDLAGLCQFHIYTNFGAARQILINDIRVVESDEFPEGLVTLDSIGSHADYLRVAPSEEELPAASVMTFDTEGIDLWQDTRYKDTEFRFPDLVITDADGNVDRNVSGKVSVLAPDGIETTSWYFTPDVQGMHSVTFTARDWYGRELKIEKQFEVKGSNPAPMFREFSAQMRCAAGATFTIPTVSAIDPEGEAVSVRAVVTGPDGKNVALNGSAFEAELPGTYRILFVATDAAGQITTADMEVSVYQHASSKFAPWREPGPLAGIIVGSVVGGLLAIGGAVTAVVLARRKKRRAADSDSLERGDNLEIDRDDTV